MKIAKCLIIVFLVIGNSPLLFAQPAGAVVKTIEGKNFYEHTVAKGETVYGLSKIYKVTQDEILQSNPGSEKGIKPGDVLKIPAKNVKVENKQDQVKETNQSFHIVSKGETLYGISKLYGVAQEKLIELNPEAKNGISNGQKLKLPSGVKPKQNIVLEEKEKIKEPELVREKEIKNENVVLVEHIVKQGETIYALSIQYRCSQDSIKLYNNNLSEGLKKGQVIIIPVSKSLAVEKGWRWYPDLRTMEVTKDKEKQLRKNVYHVGLFLPFYLDKNQSILENQTSNSPVELYEPTRQSLDFYHGVLVALDSLSKFGLSVKLHVFDTYKDSARIARLVNDAEFSELDLIIGPTDRVEMVANAAKQKQIPLVCPFGYTNKILFDNPYVVKMVTSTSVIISSTSSFIVRNYAKENIILIDGRGKKDVPTVASFRTTLNADLSAAGIKDTVKYVKAESFASKAWIDKLSKEKLNVIILPNTDYGYVSSFFNTLSGTSLKPAYKDYRFLVVGLEEWLKFEDIDLPTKNKFNVTIPASINVNFNDTLNTIPFIRSFRKKFNTDPDKYAMMGFDIANFFLSGYLLHGKEFISKIDQYEIEGVNTVFKFRQINASSGYLNTQVYFLRFQDFQLVKIE